MTFPIPLRTVGPRVYGSGMTDEKLAPAGWYRDDSRPKLERYWNGKRWTAKTRIQGEIPPLQRMADKRAAAQREREEARAKIVCQFCQEPGNVTVDHFKKDKRLSATRLVGGIVTAGGSFAVAGATKKGWVTRMTCSNCKMTWELQG